MIRQVAKANHRIICAFRTSKRSSSTVPGGAGYTGNIFHQMVPVDEEGTLFRHVKHPNTISIIG